MDTISVIGLICGVLLALGSCTDVAAKVSWVGSEANVLCELW